MDTNSFGQLVRAYRKQRNWKQEELAQRWGFTREYVSQIERGTRKLDKSEQVYRLADILGIPEEKLAAAGKDLPYSRRISTPITQDDALLQILLEPAQDTVKMSWIVWKGDGQVVDLEKQLTELGQKLENALSVYNGQFKKPALRLLAYTHEMLGKLAINRTKTLQAISHFQTMYDIAEEVGDTGITALALIHQSEMFRRRKWYEASARRMAIAESYIQNHEIAQHIQGSLWQASAINHFTYGAQRDFLRAIDHALKIAENTKTTIDALSNDFELVEVLQTKAQGFTMFRQPEKALEIYKHTDKIRTFRPLREQASYLIIKAQAHCAAGDLKKGIKFAQQGMEMAESLHSIRYVTRLQQMSDRLQSTPIGQERDMMDLRQSIFSTLQRLADEE